MAAPTASTKSSRALRSCGLSALRPYLDTLMDGGSRSAAGGEVVIDATGRPVAYTVAPNDLLPEVAGRFGITPDDAFYLNPARAGSPEYPMLDANEVLNLNLRAR